MPIHIIAALSTHNFGIGYQGNIPWDIPEDLTRFKELTQGNVVVMGRKTWESLPEKQRPLKHRFNIVITSNFEVLEETLVPDTKSCGDCEGDTEQAESDVMFASMERAMFEIQMRQRYSNVFIIGGSSLYEHFLPLADTVYLTLVNKRVECDTFFPMKHLHKFQISEYSTLMVSTSSTGFQYVTYKPINLNSQANDERQYLQLARDILTFGNTRDDRTGTGTISLFGKQLTFDISQSIPLITTKQVPFKTILKELLFFIKGDTNSKNLENQGVAIWRGNTTRDFLDNRGLTSYKEGDMGPMYGYNWRHYGGVYKGCHDPESYKGGFDQLTELIEGLKNDPYSRRHMITTFNPSTVAQSVLAPCHGIIVQFYVENIESDNASESTKHLSCHVYCRSSDTFLGLPFNIASYAIFTYLIAKLANMVPSTLIMSLGDAHIYSNHVSQITEQIARPPLPFPVLQIKDRVKDMTLEEISEDDFKLIGYLHHPQIKAPMAV